VTDLALLQVPQPSETPRLQGAPAAAIGQAMSTLGKEVWTKLAKQVESKIAEVCHGSAPADRKRFIDDVQQDRKKMNHLRKQSQRTGRPFGDTVRDLYSTWARDTVNMKNGKGAPSTTRTPAARASPPPRGADGDGGDGWRTVPTRKAAASSSANSPSSRSPSAAQRGAGQRGAADESKDAWRNLEVADETPLIDSSTGEEATRLDLDAALEDASGYLFCHCDRAAELHRKYATSVHPITFIMPRVDDKTRVGMERALKRMEDHYEKAINPGLTDSTMFIKEPSSGRKKNVQVTLVHVDRAMKICPPQDVEDGMLFADSLPSVDLDLPTDIEVQFTIMKPICKELALTEWWDKLAARPFPLFKDDIKRVITSAKFKPTDIQVRRDRNLVWKGERMTDARIATSVKVPAEHVDELMTRSGRHGIIIDVLRRGRADQTDAYAKLKLSSDWDMAEAISRVDALPLHLKKHTRGIVPSAKGYLLRMVAAAEAEITKALAPEVAAQLGPALGMKAESTWIVKGIPRSATREGIIRCLNLQTSRWGGWTVRPKRVVGQPRFGKVDWLVEAASDPPGKALTVKTRETPNGDCIMIERFVEEQKTTAKAAPWFKPFVKQEPTSTSRSGALWADMAEQDDDEDTAFQMFDPSADVADSARMDDASQVTRDDAHHRIHDAHDHLPEVNTAPQSQHESPESLAKRMKMAGFGAVPRRRPSPMVPSPQADQNSEILSMLRAMQEANQAKDNLIAQLQETIKGLNAQISAMGATLATMQNAFTGHHGTQGQELQHQQLQQTDPTHQASGNM
jgi:hypothetical protein